MSAIFVANNTTVGIVLTNCGFRTLKVYMTDARWVNFGNYNHNCEGNHVIFTTATNSGNSHL